MRKNGSTALVQRDHVKVKPRLGALRGWGVDRIPEQVRVVAAVGEDAAVVAAHPWQLRGLGRGAWARVTID